MSQMPPMEPPQVPQEAPGATAGLVLGILSIVLSWPIVGLVLGIIGYQKSSQARALCEANPGYYSNAGVAQAGYICSIIGIVLGSLTMLCGCGYFIFVLAMIASGA